MYENEIYPDIQNNALEAVTEGGKDNGMGGGKKKKGTVRKVVLSMGLGLTFGVFAGAGFSHRRNHRHFMRHQFAQGVRHRKDHDGRGTVLCHGCHSHLRVPECVFQ